MVMRIATIADFETAHGHEGSALVVRHDSGHHDAHLKLGPQRQQGRHQVGIVPHEIEAGLLAGFQETPDSSRRGI